MSEVEERITVIMILLCTLKRFIFYYTRIRTHKGVKCLLIVGDDGNIIRKNMASANDKEPKIYAQLISDLAKKARSVVRDVNPLDDLTFFRIKAKRQEFLVAPDKSYFLIVIQVNEEEEQAVMK